MRSSNITPDGLMDSIKKNVTKLFSNNLNNKSAGSAVMSQYLTSQVISRGRLTRSSAMARSRSEESAVVTREQPTSSRGY